MESKQSARYLTADEAVHDLTLALLYLSHISNSSDPKYYWNVNTNYKASTAFDKQILSWLDEVGFVETQHLHSREKVDHSARHHDELTITPAGVHRAREILANLHINDWDKAEIAKAATTAHDPNDSTVTEMGERAGRSERAEAAERTERS